MTSNSTTTSAPADELAATLKRTEIQHSGSSIPGRDIVQVRTPHNALDLGTGQMLSTYVVETGKPIATFAS